MRLMRRDNPSRTHEGVQVHGGGNAQPPQSQVPPQHERKQQIQGGVATWARDGGLKTANNDVQTLLSENARPRGARRRGDLCNCMHASMKGEGGREEGHLQSNDHRAGANFGPKFRLAPKTPGRVAAAPSRTPHLHAPPPSHILAVQGYCCSAAKARPPLAPFALSTVGMAAPAAPQPPWPELPLADFMQDVADVFAAAVANETAPLPPILMPRPGTGAAVASSSGSAKFVSRVCVVVGFVLWRFCVAWVMSLCMGVGCECGLA